MFGRNLQDLTIELNSRALNRGGPQLNSKVLGVGGIRALGVACDLKDAKVLSLAYCRLIRFLSQICVGSFTQECLDTCGRNVVLELLNNQLKLIHSNDRGLDMDLVWSKLTMTSVGTSA
jgi:hypothetical protein